MKTSKHVQRLLSILLSVILSTSLLGCTSYISSSDTSGNQSTNITSSEESESTSPAETTPSTDGTMSIADIPQYDNEPYIEINGDKPFFSEQELSAATQSYKSFSQLDSLGRCGVAMASIGKDIMPTEPRGSIGMVKPSGWHTVRYDDLIEDKYLFNRCHLLAYELTSENANELNLITGTRYMNLKGMLPFENDVARYVRETRNHVLYRVTPLFDGDNLVASGVLMEAESVEDNGGGISFCVYCYNVQPGITIDYSTGNSWRSSETGGASPSATSTGVVYIGNTNSHKFHYEWCSGAKKILESHRVIFTSREEAIDSGYSPCGTCNP